MGEATQFNFSHRELLDLLIKAQDVHEGLWTLVVNFGLGAGNVGPNPNELNPAAIATVLSVAIQRTTENTNLTIDAATSNPKS